MSESSVEERLARLQARGRASAKPEGANTRADRLPADRLPIDQVLSDRVRADERGHGERADVISIVGSAPQSASAPGPNHRGADDDHTPGRRENGRWRPTWSSHRLAAGAASVVSFASMIVAMGPLFAAADGAELDTTGPATETDLASEPVPVAPAVEIEAGPDGVSNQIGEALPPEASGPAGTEASVAGSARPTPASTALEGAVRSSPADATEIGPAPASAGTAAAPAAPAPEGTAPPMTAPPTTAAGAGAVASTTAAPATAAPTTAAPTTAAPTTAAPTTAPPSTAPPSTAAATTAPPRSEGSG